MKPHPLRGECQHYTPETRADVSHHGSNNCVPVAAVITEVEISTTIKNYAFVPLGVIQREPSQPTQTGEYVYVLALWRYKHEGQRSPALRHPPLPFRKRYL